MSPRGLLTSVTFAALLVALAIVCGGDGSSPTPSPTPSPSPVVILPSPTPEATPTAPEALTVTGLFTDPRPTTPDTVRSLGAEPGVSFQPWDGVSTVLYDTVTGRETNLGEGYGFDFLGAFSPESTKMVWEAGRGPLFEEAEVWVIDLSTMEKRSLGPGGFERCMIFCWLAASSTAFIDDEHVVLVDAAGNNPETVDLVTGERIQGVDVPLSPDLVGVTTPDGHVLSQHELSGDPPTNDYVLRDGETGRPLLEFRALAAAPAGHGELVVATPPANGTTNIFIVEIATGEATFIATSELSQTNLSLAANEQYVMWIDDFMRDVRAGVKDGCGNPPGRNRLYDRRTGLLTELLASTFTNSLLKGSFAAEFTPGGLIAARTRFGASFGARALIDPVTLEYVAVVPERAGHHPSWSPDYRYFTLGVSGGHGVC